MSGPDDTPKSLSLLGYAVLTQHGFALPCFARSLRPNIWYVALCSINGDHLGTIAGFEAFQSEDIQVLPGPLTRTVEIGQAWCDVFLWDDTPHVGTPEQLWAELEPNRAALARRAPLTLFDLGRSVPNADRHSLAQQARAFVAAQYGETKAEDWSRLTFRSAMTRELKFLATGTDGPAPAIADVKITEKNGCLLLDAPVHVQKAIESSGKLQQALDDLKGLASDLSFAFTDFQWDRPPNIKPPNGRFAAQTAQREQDAKALFDKGTALAARDQYEEAIAVYDVLLARFGDAAEPALQEWVVKALVNKGSALGAHAIRLSETGDRQAALEPARRAVEIREALAEAEPARFAPLLENSRKLLEHIVG